MFQKKKKKKKKKKKYFIIYNNVYYKINVNNIKVNLLRKLNFT